jgi:CRISPR-associated endonuclease/helicase Cas3
MNKGALMDFDDFFQHMTNKQPYAYQRLLAERDWFDVLIAPTGLGKTAAVIAVWLWRRQLKPQQTPRRLVYCLPMRTLVEQTEKNARCWLERLARAGLGKDLPSVDDVYVLMGGGEPPRGRLRWYEAPERPAILIGTQDMLISRALMRGYASGRARWPAEFALLHNDALWVFDEVQLMGAGLATSAQLAAFRERLGSALPTKSLWVSATLDPCWLRTVNFHGPQKILRVPGDVPQDAHSHAVRSLIEAHKPLAKATVAPTGAKEAEIKLYVRDLADFVQKKRAPRGRTLVIVNTVDRAQKLRAALLEIGISEHELILIHSRFRPQDRREQMERLMAVDDTIAVATQAIEAGVDISSAVMITELAPWASLVQRFGRVNRYGERKKEEGGAPVYWVDLPVELAAPYDRKHLDEARERLISLADAAPANLGDPGQVEPPRRVIRQKDLIDLFDIDPDLTGFDVDISPYVRDAADTDVQVFWRNLKALATETEPVRPSRNELCAVSIGRARDWVKALRARKLSIYVPDPQWRKGERARADMPPGWRRLDGEPWPGVTLLVDAAAGGYDPTVGFVGEASQCPVMEIAAAPPDQTETDQEEGEETNEGFARPVTLVDHIKHVVAEAESLCTALSIGGSEKNAILRAARWHDLGKAHDVFQETMRRGLAEPARYDGVLLAKTEKQHLRHKRSYFRHELASALAFLAHKKWDREADLVAYLIASHHGKVRMSLRARPEERQPDGEQAGVRFARGIWEGDKLPAVDLGDGVVCPETELKLTIMELGEDSVTGASWTERTRALLSEHGPFKLAWLEALLAIADWRASARERIGSANATPSPARGGSDE